MHGNCPKCEKLVTHCNVDEIGIGDRLIGAYFHGLALCCPHCRSVLGVTPDPDILINDIAQRVVHKLSGLGLSAPLMPSRPRDGLVRRTE